MPTLLVLEDDPAMIAYLRSALDEVLLHLRPVSTVEEALKIAGRNPPTTALVGWPLEDREALPQFVRMFRALHGCAEVPIILLSVDDDPHTRAQAAQLGVDIFLPHPIELVRLHHAISTGVERAMTPHPKVAVLRDPDAARQIEEAGIECFLYFSLEELLREIDIQCPDAILLGSGVTGKQVPAIIGMSAWDSDFMLLCFDDSPLAQETEINERLDRASGWLVQLHREAERMGRLRRQQLRCSQTGLLARSASVAALEAGLSSAQRHGRTYSLGLIRATGLDSLDHVRARRLGTHLGRLIYGRFRREDVRGRWDESTFVVGFDGSRRAGGRGGRPKAQRGARRTANAAAGRALLPARRGRPCGVPTRRGYGSFADSRCPRTPGSRGRTRPGRVGLALVLRLARLSGTG